MQDTSEENSAVSKDLEENESKGRAVPSKTPLMVSERQDLDRSAVNC